MENEFEKLVKQLETYLILKGGIASVEELIDWGDKNGIGAITLQAIVHELLRKGIIEAGEESVMVEGMPPVELPTMLKLKKPAKKREEPAAKKHRPTKRRAKPRDVTSLMNFISQPEALTKRKNEKPQHKPIQKPPVKHVKKEKPTMLLEPVLQKPSVQRYEAKKAEAEVPPTPSSEELDEDLRKAISYLNSYWSVGEIRFLMDMKNMGVKHPENLLKRLLELGYVERSTLGVINATKLLPRIKEKKPLVDLIF